MMNILIKLNSALHSITPHINDATSGIINKLGLASVVTGGTNAIVTTAIETQNEAWLTLSDAVAVMSIMGSIMFVVNIIANVYFRHRKDRREQEEHDRKNEL